MNLPLSLRIQINPNVGRGGWRRGTEKQEGLGEWTGVVGG